MIDTASATPTPRYSVYAPDSPKETPPQATTPGRPPHPPSGVVVGGCGCLVVLFLISPILAVAWWRLFCWADAQFSLWK
jgi:hypothetical protein